MRFQYFILSAVGCFCAALTLVVIKHSDAVKKVISVNHDLWYFNTGGLYNRIAADTLVQNSRFQDFVHKLKKAKVVPAVVFVSEVDVNVTLNFLCNTKHFTGNVHDQLVLVTMDDNAQTMIKQWYPELRMFNWPLSGYQSPEVAEHAYTAFRLNFLLAMTQYGLRSWAIRQDTVWTQNILMTTDQVEAHAVAQEQDILFDRAGLFGTQTHNLVNAAVMYIRPTAWAMMILAQAMQELRNKYAIVRDDADALNRVCVDQPRCGRFSFDYAATWNWFYRNDAKTRPQVFHMGCESSDKLERLRDFGFNFLDDLECDKQVVDETITRLRKGSPPHPKMSPSRDACMERLKMIDRLMQVSLLEGRVHDYTLGQIADAVNILVDLSTYLMLTVSVAGLLYVAIGKKNNLFVKQKAS